MIKVHFWSALPSSNVFWAAAHASSLLITTVSQYCTEGTGLYFFQNPGELRLCNNRKTCNTPKTLRKIKGFHAGSLERIAAGCKKSKSPQLSVFFQTFVLTGKYWSFFFAHAPDSLKQSEAVLQCYSHYALFHAPNTVSAWTGAGGDTRVNTASCGLRLHM